MSTLDIVIVNWNTGGLLRDCLRSLDAADLSSVQRVVVVDNASEDGSAADLRLDHGALKVIRNDGNRGFAAACNQGAAGSAADYLLFLNPDTRVERDTLSRSVAYLDAHADVGILGVQLADDDGQIQRTCARLPTPGQSIGTMLGLDTIGAVPSHFMTEWDHAETREVEQVIGAYFLTRRALFEEMGGFDERFFVYFEEVDYTVRARERGWKTVYYAGARAYHYGGGSSENVEDRRLFYVMRSRLLFFAKHFPLQETVAYGVALFVIELPARLALAGLRGSREYATSTLSAFRMFADELPALTRQIREH